MSTATRKTAAVELIEAVAQLQRDAKRLKQFASRARDAFNGDSGAEDTLEAAIDAAASDAATHEASVAATSTTLRAALVTFGVPTADLPTITQLTNRSPQNPNSP